MDRSQLLAELHGHGNHLNITRSEKPTDLAKGLGLLLLAFEQLLSVDDPCAGRPVEMLYVPEPQPEAPPQSAKPSSTPKWQRSGQPQTQIRIKRNGGRLR